MNDWLDKAKAWLTQFWLPAMPAERVALVRIGIGIYLLQDFYRTRNAVIALGKTDPKMWDPVGVTTLLSGPIDPTVWAWFHDATILAAIFWTLGLAWRVTGPLLAGMLLFLWTYRVSWQMLYHVHHLPMLHVLVMGAAPGAAAALSLDRLWKRSKGVAAPKASWQFGWPIRAICSVTVWNYWLAGYAKINLVGWHWADGNNLLHQIAYDGIYKSVLAQPSEEPYPAIAFAFQHPWIMFPLAAFALGIEIGAPLAMFNRWLAAAYSVATCSMHWGIHMFMNLVFPYHMFGFAFLSFFELERLIPRKYRSDPDFP